MMNPKPHIPSTFKDADALAPDRANAPPDRANAPREFELRWQYLADERERFQRGERPHTALSPRRAVVMSESQ